MAVISMASEQAIPTAGGESMGMPGQLATGFGFARLTAAHERGARSVDGGPNAGANDVGRLSMQSEIRYCKIRYERPPDGTITEAERCYTGETSIDRGDRDLARHRRRSLGGVAERPKRAAPLCSRRCRQT
jgi:hypothetical protein